MVYLQADMYIYDNYTNQKVPLAPFSLGYTIHDTESYSAHGICNLWWAKPIFGGKIVESDILNIVACNN